MPTSRLAPSGVGHSAIPAAGVFVVAAASGAVAMMGATSGLGVVTLREVSFGFAPVALAAFAAEVSARDVGAAFGLAAEDLARFAGTGLAALFAEGAIPPSDAAAAVDFGGVLPGARAGETAGFASVFVSGFGTDVGLSFAAALGLVLGDFLATALADSLVTGFAAS